MNLMQWKNKNSTDTVQDLYPNWMSYQYERFNKLYDTLRKADTKF